MRCAHGLIAAVLISLAPGLIDPAGAADPPRPEAACAAHDLHLLDAIEAAGAAGSEDPDILWATFEAVMSARHVCGSDLRAGVAAYETLSVRPALRWLR